MVLAANSGAEALAQPSLPPEAAQEGDLHLLWEALARKRRMSREPTLDSISELPEEDTHLQLLRQGAEEAAPDLSEDYSTADELARTGEADLSHTSSDDESRAGTPSLVTYLKRAGKPGVSPLASEVSLACWRGLCEASNFRQSIVCLPCLPLLTPTPAHACITRLPSTHRSSICSAACYPIPSLLSHPSVPYLSMHSVHPFAHLTVSLFLKT